MTDALNCQERAHALGVISADELALLERMQQFFADRDPNEVLSADEMESAMEDIFGDELPAAKLALAKAVANAQQHGVTQ